MAHLTFNGQRIQFPGKGILTYLDSSGNVVDWANTYYTTLDSNPDMSGDKIIRWNMWLESDATGHLFSFGVSNQNFNARISASNILSVGNWDRSDLDSSRLHSVVGLTEKKIECIAVKSSTEMVWMQMGGIGFYSTNAHQSGTDYVSSRVGANGMSSVSDIANNMYVWNIQIDDLAAWSGNGASANTNSAWVDTIGSNDCTFSGSPEKAFLTFPTPNYTDWFLPSQSELDAMRTNLYDSAVGSFEDGWYWSSSESSSTNSNVITFSSGNVSALPKINNARVRAARKFTAAVSAYALRDTGPAGGLIFYIDGGTTYYEAAPSDNLAGGNDSGGPWGNITDSSVGTTGTAIGDGTNNTSLIVNQTDHIYSCGGLCTAYEIYL